VPGQACLVPDSRGPGPARQHLGPHGPPHPDL